MQRVHWQRAAILEMKAESQEEVVDQKNSPSGVLSLFRLDCLLRDQCHHHCSKWGEGAGARIRPPVHSNPYMENLSEHTQSNTMNRCGINGICAWLYGCCTNDQIPAVGLGIQRGCMSMQGVKEPQRRRPFQSSLCWSVGCKWYGPTHVWTVIPRHTLGSLSKSLTERLNWYCTKFGCGLNALTINYTFGCKRTALPLPSLFYNRLIWVPDIDKIVHVMSTGQPKSQWNGHCAEELHTDFVFTS